MKKVVGVVTTDFGFGPVSKAMYIIHAILEECSQVTVRFFGELNSKQFIYDNCKSNNVEIFDMTVLFDDRIGVYSCDLLIDVMNFDILEKINEKLIDIYFVDSLSWMWDDVPKNLYKVKKYYIQNYLLNKSKLLNYQAIADVSIIGPIVDKSYIHKEKKEKMLLVNYSGVHNPYVSDEYFYTYCKTMTECVLNTVGDRFKTIRFAMNKSMASKLNCMRDYYSNLYKLDIEFANYDHLEFLKLVNKSSFILTNAGITTTLELQQYNRAYAYLLGTNYSQALMIYMYREKYGINNLIDFSEFNKNMDNIFEMEEEEGVNVISNYVTDIMTNNKSELEKKLVGLFDMSIEKVLENNKKIPFVDGKEGQLIIARDVKKELVNYENIVFEDTCCM